MKPPIHLIPNDPPDVDPAELFEIFRGNFGSELLVSAVTEFDVFEKLYNGPLSWAALRKELKLSERAMTVLITALRSMGLITSTLVNELQLTPMARRHLIRSSPYYVGDYFGLAAQSAGVLEMTRRLRTDKPKGASPGGVGSGESSDGVGFIFKPGIDSAMEKTDSARSLTLALAGRAKNVAPMLARALPLGLTGHLLDVGGGTGIYSIAFLRANPQLRATVWDRPEVLRVAKEFAAASGVESRLELLEGDMFGDPWPKGADITLFSNILHDWDVEDCRRLLKRCARESVDGSRVVIHDVFLNDSMDGPLPIALYSAALFCVTEGRAYSVAEYREMMKEAGIHPVQKITTLIHCGALIGVISKTQESNKPNTASTS